MLYDVMMFKCDTIRDALMKKNELTFSAAERLVAPVRWYIATDRASLDFCRALCACKSSLIARDLIKGGSDDEMIGRVKSRIAKFE